MKISFLQLWKLAVCGAALALMFACLIQSAQSEAPKDATAAAPPPIPDAETNNPAVESEHKVIQAVPPAKPPEEVKLSAALAEVIKLVQAGVGEDVILAFVNNSTNVF